MRIKILLLIIITVSVFLSCKKSSEELIENNKLVFSNLIFTPDDSTYQISELLVEYEEIIGYDSAKHVFQLNELAWEKLRYDMFPGNPDSNLAFGVLCNDKLISVSYTHL